MMYDTLAHRLKYPGLFDVGEMRRFLEMYAGKKQEYE